MAKSSATLLEEAHDVEPVWEALYTHPPAQGRHLYHSPPQGFCNSKPSKARMRLRAAEPGVRRRILARSMLRNSRGVNHMRLHKVLSPMRAPIL